MFWGLKRKKRVLGSTKQEEAKEDLRKTKFLLATCMQAHTYMRCRCGQSQMHTSVELKKKRSHSSRLEFEDDVPRVLRRVEKSCIITFFSFAFSNNIFFFYSNTLFLFHTLTVTRLEIVLIRHFGDVYF